MSPEEPITLTQSSGKIMAASYLTSTLRPLEYNTNQSEFISVLGFSVSQMATVTPEILSRIKTAEHFFHH